MCVKDFVRGVPPSAGSMARCLNARDGEVGALLCNNYLSCHVSVVGLKSFHVRQLLSEPSPNKKHFCAGFSELAGDSLHDLQNIIYATLFFDVIFNVSHGSSREFGVRGSWSTYLPWLYVGL